MARPATYFDLRRTVRSPDRLAVIIVAKPCPGAIADRRSRSIWRCCWGVDFAGAGRCVGFLLLGVLLGLAERCGVPIQSPMPPSRIADGCCSRQAGRRSTERSRCSVPLCSQPSSPGCVVKSIARPPSALRMSPFSSCAARRADSHVADLESRLGVGARKATIGAWHSRLWQAWRHPMRETFRCLYGAVVFYSSARTGGTGVLGFLSPEKLAKGAAPIELPKQGNIGVRRVRRTAHNPFQSGTALF